LLFGDEAGFDGEVEIVFPPLEVVATILVGVYPERHKIRITGVPVAA
jgi:hypothetical protein